MANSLNRVLGEEEYTHAANKRQIYSPLDDEQDWAGLLTGLEPVSQGITRLEPDWPAEPPPPVPQQDGPSVLKVHCLGEEEAQSSDLVVTARRAVPVQAGTQHLCPKLGCGKKYSRVDSLKRHRCGRLRQSTPADALPRSPITVPPLTSSLPRALAP